jgi:hypothetical protein
VAPQALTNEARPPARRRFSVLKAAAPIAAVIGVGAWLAANQPPQFEDAFRTPNVAVDDALGPGAPVVRDNDVVEGLLREAWQDIGDARFIGPGDNDTLTRLRRVLDIDPENERAKNAMAVLHTYFMRKAERAAMQDDRAGALAHAKQASATSVNDKERGAARRLMVSLRSADEEPAMR